MKLNEYQEEAMLFAKYNQKEYPFLALSEESGEVMGKLAKYVRKRDCSVGSTIHRLSQSTLYDHETQQLAELIKKELGDVLWQLQACCSELNLTLEEVAKYNLEKLADRDNRGVIVGEGDER